MSDKQVRRPVIIQSDIRYTRMNRDAIHVFDPTRLNAALHVLSAIPGVILSYGDANASFITAFIFGSTIVSRFAMAGAARWTSSHYVAQRYSSWLVRKLVIGNQLIAWGTTMAASSVVALGIVGNDILSPPQRPAVSSQMSEPQRPSSPSQQPTQPQIKPAVMSDIRLG